MGESNEEIQALLNQSEDELFIHIGRQLHGDAAFPLPPGQLLRASRAWLDKKRKEIADRVCRDEKVAILVTEEKSIQDRIILVSAIADLIASIVVGVSPVTVSVLLVKEGINSFCQEIWSSNESGQA